MRIALCELNNYAYVHYKKRKGGEEREREREERKRVQAYAQANAGHSRSLFNFPFCPFLFGAYNLTLSSLYIWLNYCDALSDCNETILVSACPSVYVWSQVLCLGYYVYYCLLLLLLFLLSLLDTFSCFTVCAFVGPKYLQFPLIGRH